MFFDDIFLQELRDRNDIVDVISMDVDLKQSGNRFLGLCPFHGEKTPSFHVSRDQQLYYCFGCHQGGNVINYIQKAKNLDFKEAVVFLAERVNMPVAEDDGVVSKEYELKMRIYEMNRAAARFFYNNLKTEQGKIAVSYLKNRGLSEKTINTYGLGYALNSWNALYKHLSSMGYSEYEMLKAGLIVKKEKGAFDFFRNRVMFPVIDLRGNVIAFGGRVFGDEKPKYLNTGETPAFKKRMNLFSLNKAKNTNKDYIILAEGYMDVISLYQHGFTNAVASLGTAFCEDHAKLLKKHTANVYICYDNDRAGQDALHKAANILVKEDVSVKVLKLTGGKDPDEILKRFGEDYFSNIIKNAKPYTEYVLEQEKKDVDLTSFEGKLKYARQAVKALLKVSDNLERALYIKQLSNELDLSEDMIRSEYEKQYKSSRNAVIKKTEQKEFYRRNSVTTEDRLQSNLASCEAELISIIINDIDNLNKIKSMINEEFFTVELYRKIFGIISEIKEANRGFDTNLIVDKLNDAEKSEFIKIIMCDVKYDDFRSAFNSLVSRIGMLKNQLGIKTAASAEDLNRQLKNLRARKGINPAE
ncbi:MAG: DNA primase [Clostridia bacterium]|nr:DNA primase [Clostridia bacterium]